MVHQQGVAIPRTKFSYRLVPIDQSTEHVAAALNDLGGAGYALMGAYAIGSGDAARTCFLLAQPIGVDIVGPGILG